MAYRLKRRESVPHGIRRLADEELCSAVDALHSADATARAETVHEARKSIKKVRALLELARADLGRKYKQDKQRLREAAQPLSQERDAKILLETFDALRKQHRADLRPATWTALRRSLAAWAADVTGRVVRPASIAHTLKALAQVRHDSRSWSLKAKGFGALRPGLKRSFTRSRKAMRSARSNPSPANLHQWRKRLKTHWYQVRLIRAAVPQRLRPYLSGLHHLESWLGDAHNLVVLDQRIKAAALPESMDQDVTRLRALIEQKTARLRKEAFDLGALLYIESPATFVRRHERLWHAWR